MRQIRGRWWGGGSTLGSPEYIFITIRKKIHLDQGKNLCHGVRHKRARSSAQRLSNAQKKLHLHDVLHFYTAMACSLVANFASAQTLIFPALLLRQGSSCPIRRTAAADRFQDGQSERSVAGGPKKLASLQNLNTAYWLYFERQCMLTSIVINLNAKCVSSVSLGQCSARQLLRSITCTSL